MQFFSLLFWAYSSGGVKIYSFPAYQKLQPQWIWNGIAEKTVSNLSYMHSWFSGLISFDIDKMPYILQKMSVGCS